MRVGWTGCMSEGRGMTGCMSESGGVTGCMSEGGGVTVGTQRGCDWVHE